LERFFMSKKNKKDEFNIIASLPITSDSHNYIIEPVYPDVCDAFHAIFTAESLKKDMSEWVLKKTGCLPEIAVCAPAAGQAGARNTLDIHCTPSFIQELVAAFHGRIKTITRQATYQEIRNSEGPGMCWRDGP
jgi:hypothetical protein